MSESLLKNSSYNSQTKFINLITLSMSEIIQEVTHLFPVEVDSVFAPTSIEEIQKILTENSGKISVG